MPSTRHEQETAANLVAWNAKPLLREVYADLFARIEAVLDPTVPGRVVEIGSGIGNLGAARTNAITTDRWIEPWLDAVCSAYSLPFCAGTVSNLILLDVFHHLDAPEAFLEEAARVVAPGGRVIILDPYISIVSAVIYGLFHPEPIGWTAPLAKEPGGEYYAAQGNATRFFFGKRTLPAEWRIEYHDAFAAFAYLLSGGFTRPAFYPRTLRPMLNRLDRTLSRAPRLFAARCLVVLTRAS